jgi:hypothetical protein
LTGSTWGSRHYGLDAIPRERGKVPLRVGVANVIKDSIPDMEGAGVRQKPGAGAEFDAPVELRIGDYPNEISGFH